MRDSSAGQSLAASAAIELEVLATTSPVAGGKGRVRQHLLTPSKVTAWLDCPHYLTLRSQVEDRLLAEPKPVFGSFARLLADKGLAHEQDCLEKYRSEGNRVLPVPEKRDGESFADWVDRVGECFDADWDVLYQMPFVHDGIRGVADFVLRVTHPKTGVVSYEPVDAKLTRVAAKPGHVLQLCFYADAITARTGIRPEHMHILLGSGEPETLRVNDFQPYWRRLRGQLSVALAAGPGAETEPQLCRHCEFCEFSALCEEQWRREDSPIYVAGIRKPDILALSAAGITTLGALGRRVEAVDGVQNERLRRIVDQAALQVQARENPDSALPFEMIEPGDDPKWGRGLEALPQPDGGDVFIDFEGHPFWRADTGLFFLFGLLEQTVRNWRYRAWWAHDEAAEGAAAEALVGYLAGRRSQFPGMHVYHYNHTERSSLLSLADSHGVAEAALGELVETGAFVDLYVVARNSIQVGGESYSLKVLERLTDFERTHDIAGGAGAVLQYEHWMTEPDQQDLDEIAGYNEDDVRATLALRDWLVDHRPPEMPWRPAFVEPDAKVVELDERVVELHAFGQGTDEHFLGDVLGYWWREWRAYITPKMVKLEADPNDYLDDPEVIAGLHPVELVERFSDKGKALVPAMRFIFQPQNLDKFQRDTASVILRSPEGSRFYTQMARLDKQSGGVDLLWGEKLQEAGFVPSMVVLDDWVDGKPKPQALQSYTDDVVAGQKPDDVTMALLRRDPPRFYGRGPAAGVFSDDLSDMTDWVTRMDRTVVAVQGPPGTGKTYSAAHLVHTLIRSGQRVGITAVSHPAIDNLLSEIIAVFDEVGDRDLLRAIRKITADVSKIDGVTYVKDNKRCARDEFNLIGGTTWLFASADMRAAPVDVLLVDEAGQMALADALAASLSARSIVLSGDPLQLPQVTQAVHPNGSGCSVLEHVIGDDVTVHQERGVFLSQTRRMHPDVCRFISEQIYEGRLESYQDCKRQSTSEGTGLRWLRAEHRGRTTASPEEAELIAEQINALIGTAWTNRKGEEQILTAADFMVVAPYNHQVRTIWDRLGHDPRTAGVAVGTVDKFQGGEAPVVFFSMATSSGDDVVRGAEFLFSRNRLNVAVSRARCLAYLVCTDELLNTRARDVDEMRLISTLNAFVELAQEQAPD